MYNDYYNMREYVTKEYRSRLATCEEGFNDDNTIYYYDCCDGLFGLEGATVNDCVDAKHLGSWEPDKCGCEWVLKDISKKGVNKVVNFITSGEFLEFGIGFKKKELSCLDDIKRFVSVCNCFTVFTCFKYPISLIKEYTVYERLLYIVSNVLHVLYREYDGCIDSKLEHKVCEALIKNIIKKVG